MQPAKTECMKILIVDDEELICENLKAILSEHINYNISIAGMANDTCAAEQLIAVSQPDLVLLDINMPGENAFEFLHRLGNFSFEVIFVTAHDEFALKAFKLNAIDYILKPISISDITIAIGKARERLIQKKIASGNPSFYSKILQQVYNKSSPDQFTFRDNKTVNIIPFKDIIYLEAKGAYSRIYYTHNNREQSFIMSHSLSEYEQLLPYELFYRVHKSYLINRMHVMNVTRSGNPATLLTDNRSLPVGRRRLSKFLSFLNGI